MSNYLRFLLLITTFPHTLHLNVLSRCGERVREGNLLDTSLDGEVDLTGRTLDRDILGFEVSFGGVEL